MTEPEDTVVVGPEVLKAQLSSAAIMAGVAKPPVESGAAVEEQEYAEVAVANAPDVTEQMARDALKRACGEYNTVFPIDGDPRPANVGRMQPAEAFLYDAFRSAARDLKSADLAFKAAQKAYAEAVGKLSEAVTK